MQRNLKIIRIISVNEAKYKLSIQISTVFVDTSKRNRKCNF